MDESTTATTLIVIPADASNSIRLIPATATTFLESAQGGVGGDIELIGGHAQPFIILADEDGRLRGKPVNSRASALAAQLLVGDVVIADRGPEDMGPFAANTATLLAA